MGRKRSPKKVMSNKVTGGRAFYGHVVGILMSDSNIPRIPGDPGHAETFSFPVIHEVLEGFPFEDLVAIKKDNLEKLILPAQRLQNRGVSLVAADCGLFGPFHEDIKNHLTIPFIGTALDLIPLLQRLIPTSNKVGIITGDTRILSHHHLESSDIDPESVVIVGMERSTEFNEVVINRKPELDIERMRQGVIDASDDLIGKEIGAVVLECTNLISYKTDIQKRLNIPVFDLVDLIEFYVSGLRLRNFTSRYISQI